MYRLALMRVLTAVVWEVILPQIIEDQARQDRLAQAATKRIRDAEPAVTTFNSTTRTGSTPRARRRSP